MAAGRAKLAIGEGVSVWVLEAPDGFGDAHVHAHHAIQITVCLRGELSLANEQTIIRTPAIAVAADAPHRFEAYGLLVFIFVEPESRAGRAFHARFFANAALASLDAAELIPSLQPLADTFTAGLSSDRLVAAGRHTVDALVPSGVTCGPDPRVQRVIDYAAAHLDEKLTLTSASAGVPLSPSRLRHLFVEQTGLAFKTYLLWLRLIRALQVYSEGVSSLTEAAHAAGFADSAHFSRTFKRTFGLPATTLERF
jgi:AraC family transcriptional regulator